VSEERITEANRLSKILSDSGQTQSKKSELENTVRVSKNVI